VVETNGDPATPEDTPLHAPPPAERLLKENEEHDGGPAEDEGSGGYRDIPPTPREPPP
jgi:hypothetical protein